MEATEARVAIELVESAPVETTLDHPDVANAADVWPQMIDAATRAIDFAEFYASEAEPRWVAQSKLTPVIGAVERAVKRGVRVRFLVDSLFAPKYPETLGTLRGIGADVRIFDVQKRTGGVLHAKYFVVDGRDAFMGSQNFDWRALSHIVEMGVRVRSVKIAGALEDVFETDWQLAAGAPDATRVRAHPGGVDGNVRFVASPRGWLPDEAEWDLAAIEEALAKAKRAIDVEVLTYKTKDREGGDFHALDDAVRAAAARGVHVRLLVSEWGKKDAAVLAIANVPNVELRILTIPKWSGGDVPFARVAHAKYMIADDVAWVGTSNWEGDYFTKSRNVGVIVTGGDLPAKLRAYFDVNWSSAYAAPPSDSGPARP
ncbi:MAG TPA: phospholipase D-like domain-containing protein [Labilithrix sp.]